MNYEFWFSGSPGAQIVYAQSSVLARDFFSLFLHWLHLHPHEFEQTALSGFLQHGVNHSISLFKYRVIYFLIEVI